jgi:hypothetical protein
VIPAHGQTGNRVREFNANNKEIQYRRHLLLQAGNDPKNVAVVHFRSSRGEIEN